MRFKNFCPFCGFQFKYQNAIKCPKCKQDLLTHLKYPKHCSNCGEIFDYSNTLLIPICESCGVKTEDELDFSLRGFLVENSNLFVIFGVFIALSVYLTQFISNFNYLVSLKGLNFSINFFEIAIGSSLLIAFIVLVIIVNELIKGNLVERFFEFLPKYMPLFPLGMFIRFLFLLPFIFLISGILLFLYVTYQITVVIFVSALSITLATILFVLGVAFITKVVFPKKEKSNARKPISVYMIIYSAIIGIISKLSLDFLQSIMKNSELSTPVIVFFWTLLIVSIINIIFSIGLIGLTAKIQKMKREEQPNKP